MKVNAVHFCMDNRGVGSSNNKINWYPGHMKKTLAGLDSFLRQCDVILYVLDARCPRSCINPSFDEFVRRKPVIYILNKADLATEFSVDGVRVNSTQSNATNKVVARIKKLFPKKNIVHAMVVGVPNSGKSTLINNLAKRGKAKTENRPGVTRTPQWVKAEGLDTQKGSFSLFLLDTPGVLWPDLADTKVARNLAFVGSIKDEVLDIVQLARELLVVTEQGLTLEEFAKKSGHILSGGKFDLERSAKAVLTKFRNNKIAKNLD